MISKKDYNKHNFERLNNDIGIILSSPENYYYIIELFSVIFHKLLSGEDFNEHILYDLMHLKFDPKILLDDLKQFLTYNEYVYNTDEFIKMEHLYNDYITRIAKLIKSCGNFDLYTQTIIHSFLMKKGILSKTDTFSYKKFKNDKDFKYSELGARITHGNGVCRNMASNLNDVLKKLGYDSSIIYCIVGAEKSKLGNNPVLYTLYNILRDKIKDPRFHSIVVANDNNNCLIVDPTWEAFGRLSNDDNIIELRNYVSNIYSYKFCLSKKYYNNFHYNDIKNFRKMTGFKNYLESFSDQELIQKIDIMINYLNSNLDYFVEWKNYNIDLINEIDVLDKTLSGYFESDEHNISRLKRF